MDEAYNILDLIHGRFGESIGPFSPFCKDGVDMSRIIHQATHFIGDGRKLA